MKLLREALIGLLLALAPGALAAVGAVLGGAAGFWVAVQCAVPTSPMECGMGAAVALLGLGVLFMIIGGCIGGAIGLAAGSRWCDAYEFSHPPSELDDLDVGKDAR